jgi:hypothetical protein
MPPTVKAGLRYMRQYEMGIVALRNYYLDLAHVSMFGTSLKTHRCTWPVIVGSLTFYAFS